MTSIKKIEKTKQVFKPLLDSPYPKSEFPDIEIDIQDQILGFLLLLLNDLGNYNKHKDKINKPEILKSTTLGFNSTVKQLEIQSKTKIENPIRYVFVCKSDISPQLLIQQFPNLCYLAHAKLIQLPKGSFDKLKEITHQSINIIGLKDSTLISKSFLEILNTLPDLNIEWLKEVNYYKTRINFVKTSAPLTKKVKNPTKVTKK